MIKTVLTAASLALVATAAPAIAGPADAPKQKIHFEDLDLSTASGQAKLEARIDAAAREVCFMDERPTGTRIRSKEREQCYEKALSSAKTQVATMIENRQRGG